MTLKILRAHNIQITYVTKQADFVEERDLNNFIFEPRAIGIHRYIMVLRLPDQRNYKLGIRRRKK